MDWRCIGTSYQGDYIPHDRQEEKEPTSTTADGTHDAQGAQGHKRSMVYKDALTSEEVAHGSAIIAQAGAHDYELSHKFKVQRRQVALDYCRLPCVVGIAPKHRRTVVEQLDKSLKFDVPLQDVSFFKLNRYYMNNAFGVGNSLEHVQEDLVKRRTEIFKNVFTIHGPCRNLNLWLQYIRVKTDEYIGSSTSVQFHQLPQWLLPELSQEQQRRLMLQNLDIWCRASQPFTQGIMQDFEWRDADGSCANAFYFCVALYLKWMSNPNFDILIDTCKWLKTWSNDYLSVDGIQFMIPTSIHVRVAQEPIFWQFISSILFKANIPVKRFKKIFAAYYKHLLASGVDSLKVQGSLVVLTSECLIPKLLQVGEEVSAVNILASWLSKNLYNDFGSAYVGRLGATECLYMQTQTKSQLPTSQGQVLMSLAAKVEDWILQHTEHDQRLCNAEAVSIDWEPIVLSRDILNELLYRFLDIFGSCPSIHVGSNTRWYNFAIGLHIGENYTATNSVACRLFRALLVLHILVANPADYTWAMLLADCCGPLELYKPICSLFIDQSAVWAIYALQVAENNIAESVRVLCESLKTWPKCVAILATLIHVVMSPGGGTSGATCIDDVIVKFLQMLQLEAVAVATVVEFLQHPEAPTILPGTVTIGYALALVYIWNNKSKLHTAPMFDNTVEILVNMHPRLVPHFLDRAQVYMSCATPRLLARTLHTHGNHLQVVAYCLNVFFTKHPTSLFSTLRSWLSRDIVQEPFASRALELLCGYTPSSNFDVSPVKRAIISKWRNIPMESLAASWKTFAFCI